VLEGLRAFSVLVSSRRLRTWIKAGQRRFFGAPGRNRTCDTRFRKRRAGELCAAVHPSRVAERSASTHEHRRAVSRAIPQDLSRRYAKRMAFGVGSRGTGAAQKPMPQGQCRGPLVGPQSCWPRPAGPQPGGALRSRGGSSEMGWKCAGSGWEMHGNGPKRRTFHRFRRVKPSGKSVADGSGLHPRPPNGWFSLALPGGAADGSGPDRGPGPWTVRGASRAWSDQWADSARPSAASR
jgi:hypothetical protein